jgi:hypothetical protein
MVVLLKVWKRNLALHAMVPVEDVSRKSQRKVRGSELRDG